MIGQKIRVKKYRRFQSDIPDRIVKKDVREEAFAEIASQIGPGLHFIQLNEEEKDGMAIATVTIARLEG